MLRSSGRCKRKLRAGELLEFSLTGKLSTWLSIGLSWADSTTRSLARLHPKTPSRAARHQTSPRIGLAGAARCLMKKAGEPWKGVFLVEGCTLVFSWGAPSSLGEPLSRWREHLGGWSARSLRMAFTANMLKTSRISSHAADSFCGFFTRDAKQEDEAVEALRNAAAKDISVQVSLKLNNR